MKIIDMHCDTISELMGNNISLRDNDLMIDLNKLKSSDYLLQCFAMFVPFKSRNNEENYSPYEVCNQMMDRYDEQINKNSDIIGKVLKYQDIIDNLNNNKLSSLLTIEEGGVLEGKIENLIHFYNHGVRMICLNWNFQNEIASPNIDYLKLDRSVRDFDFYSLKPNTTDGLTPFGIEVVKKMNELGIIVDCSHMGDKGFYDCIKYSTKPIVCSHSCSRTVCGAVRNMTDDMLFKLKENNGVVGINFCHDFVTESDTLATIEDVIKHIDYIKNLIGIDYIGLGSDFDGISNKNIELKDATMMPKLLQSLSNHGYSDEEIEKIAYKNVLRVMKANFGE